MKVPASIVAGALALAGLSGCADFSTNPRYAHLRHLANLDDPRTIVDPSIDGGHLVLRKGRTILVRLPSEANATARWQLRPLAGNVIASVPRADYLPPQPQGIATEPSPVVADGETLFRLRGLNPGATPVQFDYRPMGDANAAPLRSVRFDVVVE